MSIAHRVAQTFGQNSWVMRRLRPLREQGLEIVYGRRGMIRRVNGVPFRVLPRYRWHFTSEYDPVIAGFLRDRVRPGAVCLNVGANLGVYPLQFANWSGPTGRVIAFEPNPQAAAVLRRHIIINRLTERVRVIETAVADRPGEAALHAAGVDGMSKLGGPNPALSGSTVAIRIPVDTLDRFCQAEGVRPDVLMMDIEGFEIAALFGARELFRSHPPKVSVIEIHPGGWVDAGMNRAMIENLLDEFKLRAVPLSGQADPLGEYGHVSLEPVVK